MQFIIRKNENGQSYQAEACPETLLKGDLPEDTQSEQLQAGADMLSIPDADTLLRLYVATEPDSPLFPALIEVRNRYIDDLDEVESAAEIYGLIYWLLNEKGIKAEGASLEETADRLSDLDIASDSDQYTEIIFHLKDAVDRLWELELEEL